MPLNMPSKAQSATLNIKKRNNIEPRKESSEEEEIKESINIIDMKLKWLNSQEEKLSKDCDEFKYYFKDENQANY